MSERYWIGIIKGVIASLDDFKEEAVEKQCYEAACALRDAAYQLRMFVHKGEEREAFERSMGNFKEGE